MQYTTTNKSCSITIYLSLVLCLIISILLSITEISRMRLTRLYLQLATNASIDSMLSLYDKKLWEYYRVFGVDYKNNDLIKKEYASYLEPFLYDKEEQKLINNWYISKYIYDNSNINCSMLIEDTNFEKEATEYIKMLLPGKVVSMFNKNIEVNNSEDLESVYDNVVNKKEEYEKNQIYEEIDTRYFDFEKEVNKLEEYSKIINKNVAELNKFIYNHRNFSVSKSKQTARFAKSILIQINSYARDIDINIKKFRELMDEFRQKVIDSENTFYADLSSNKHNYNDITIKFIEDEFKRFKEYVDEDNEMNIKAEKLSNELDDKIDDLSHYEQEFGEYLSRIESLEQEKKSILREKYQGYTEDIKEINEEIEYIYEEIYEEGQNFRDELNGLSFTEPNILTCDEVKENLIDALKKLLSQTDDFILKITMPQERYEKLDDNKLELNDYKIASTNNLIDKILMSEYFFDMFNFYGKDVLKEETPSKSDKLEVERILYGKDNDKDNIKSVVYRILLIREGLNLLYLYSNGAKREAARSFSYATFGVLTPVVAEVVFILLLSAWAFAQAIVDVKDLLHHKKVMFFHNEESFRFDLDGLFSLAAGNLLDNDTGYEVKSGEFALNYKDYLRLLLMVEKEEVLNSRSISIIQNNINKEQSFFDIEKCIYSFEADNEFESNNIFNRLVYLLPNTTLREKFNIRIKSYASY